ncbi:hypothetical protein LCGC14_1695180 [marine sediment metagenome]|uniref:Gelsolin-like domain-containing protein n=1 Tax=marine sediment metagenome TaxID=412755 RepID=A0A0F9HK97_9ZZZZ
MKPFSGKAERRVRMDMAELRTFFVYELEDTGERKELSFSEKTLARHLNPEQVLVLVREDLRRIFIWKGAKSAVKKRFISSRVARDVQQELMKDTRYHRCKIVSIDQGDEVQEFLDAFNLESMEVNERLADMKYIRNSEKEEIIEKKRVPEEKEFRINEYITLKLIKGQTEIYIDEKPFHQCKYLLLNLTQKDFNKFDQIDSIDEAFEMYNKMDKSHEKDHDLIDPESEFIGHCSNLQVWYEHDYDLRILHSSLSIPLLKKMAFLGDKKAIIRLKESIATRIMSRNYNTIIFYLNEKYLRLFSNEELEVMFDEWLEKNVDFAFMEKRRLWYPLLRELIERGINRAQNIIKKEILLYLKEDNFEAYRYLLNANYFKLLNLEDFEELYDLIPKKDKVALRRVETLILKATLKKRRNSEVER